MTKRTGLLSATLLVVACATNAAALTEDYIRNNVTLTIRDFTHADWQEYVASFGKVVIEDFESLGRTEREFPLLSGAETAVGTIGRDWSIGRSAGDDDDGTGASVLGGKTGAVGKQVALRTGRNFGRQNTTSVDRHEHLDVLTDGFFLDSNDLAHVRWQVNPGPNTQFSSLAFVLLDAGDVGGRFALEVNGVEIYSHWRDDGHTLTNGMQHFGILDFGRNVGAEELVTLHFSFDRTNDGIGLDDLVVGLAEVPLPASGWMLLAGLGLAGAAARRR